MPYAALFSILSFLFLNSIFILFPRVNISGGVVDVGLGSSIGGADSWALAMLGVRVVAGMCGWGGGKAGWLGWLAKHGAS